MNKLITLPPEGTAVFVGDTHGDYKSVRVIIKNFIGKKNHYVIMLGDYVDRGEDSQKNIEFLIETQKEHSNLILLAGNHEMFPLKECSPADFWNSLDKENLERYKEFFLNLPFAVSGRGFLALHGGLPDIEKIEDINDIQPCDSGWTRILWGDFRDKQGDYLGDFLGRPKFGRDYFVRVMEKIGKKVLIRGHDPAAPEKMYDNRCLTIFTSSAFGPKKRKIAVCSLEKEVRTIDDMEIISLDLQEISI
jgi:predicted phosphodiesterase